MKYVLVEPRNSRKQTLNIGGFVDKNVITTFLNARNLLQNPRLSDFVWYNIATSNHSIGQGRLRFSGTTHKTTGHGYI